MSHGNGADSVGVRWSYCFPITTEGQSSWNGRRTLLIFSTNQGTRPGCHKIPFSGLLSRISTRAFLRARIHVSASQEQKVERVFQHRAYWSRHLQSVGLRTSVPQRETVPQRLQPECHATRRQHLPYTLALPVNQQARCGGPGLSLMEGKPGATAPWSPEAGLQFHRSARCLWTLPCPVMRDMESCPTPRAHDNPGSSEIKVWVRPRGRHPGPPSDLRRAEEIHIP